MSRTFDDSRHMLFPLSSCSSASPHRPRLCSRCSTGVWDLASPSRVEVCSVSGPGSVPYFVSSSGSGVSGCYLILTLCSAGVPCRRRLFRYESSSSEDVYMKNKNDVSGVRSVRLPLSALQITAGCTVRVQVITRTSIMGQSLGQSSQPSLCMGCCMGMACRSSRMTRAGVPLPCVLIMELTVCLVERRS